jgi:paraquat-inducible protein B
MTTPAAPKVTRVPTIPLVWIVPLIALGVGGWMLFRELHDRGPMVTIEFADGSGVEADRTVLEYKGVAVGTVKAVKLRPDLGGVQVKLQIEKDAAALARGGAKFWIVHPEIGLSGVRGLDTLLTGARLNVRPGDGPPAREFKGLDKTPPPEIPVHGRTFLLEAKGLGSLTTGAPVFYREFKVGEVETSRLADDATGVLVRIHIEAAYCDLVRTNTRFWNTGGFNFKVSLLGAELKDTSLESLISGGVAFATPEALPLSPPAPDGGRFTVEPEADKEWMKWEPKIPIRSPESISKAPTPPTPLSALMK